MEDNAERITEEFFCTTLWFTCGMLFSLVNRHGAQRYVRQLQTMKTKLAEELLQLTASELNLVCIATSS